jgi:DNA-binding transcriptional ArsR family regulator
MLSAMGDPVPGTLRARAGGPTTAARPRPRGAGEPFDLRVRVVTDADVLRVLADRAGGGPAFAGEMAQRLDLPEERVPVRLASLVSLGLVERLMDGKDGGFTITDRGRAELARRQRGPGESSP